MNKNDNSATDSQVIKDRIEIVADDAMQFFDIMLQLWGLALPEKRRLTGRERDVFCYMLTRSDGMGSMVNCTTGPYRKDMEEDLKMSKQNVSNQLRGLVQKRWISRKYDEFLTSYNYSFSRPVIRLRNMYFTDKYKAMQVMLNISFNA